MISENYSSNGEFAIWQNDPAHTKFQEGNVTVSTKALVNGTWTDTRDITIILKSKVPAPQLVSIQTMVAPVLGTNPKPTLNPVLNQSYKVTVKSATLAPTVTISTPSAGLTPVKPATVSTYKPNIIEILMAFLKRFWFS